MSELVRVRYWIVTGNRSEPRGMAIQTAICATAEQAIETQAKMRAEGFAILDCEKGVQPLFTEAQP